MIKVSGYTNGGWESPEGNFIEYPPIVKTFKKRGLRYALFLLKVSFLCDWLVIEEKKDNETYREIWR